MKDHVDKEGIVFSGISHFIPVKITCPNCGKICNAEVESNDDFPFNSYFHDCENCGFVITESEWDEIEEGEE